MNKEDFINQILISKLGDTLAIVSLEGDNLEDIVIKADDEKQYKLIVAYQSGYLRFKNDSFNQLFEDFFKEKEEEQRRIKRREQENIQRRLEKLRLEQQRIRDAINCFRGEYAFLSNFYECPIAYNGHTYRNNEAAFQAQKDPSRSGEFVSLNPTMAKRLGKRVRQRRDWEWTKMGIMKEIVRLKFIQHPDLKEKLLATGDRLLIETNAWNGTYWGVCKGRGQNYLGKILMKIREELRN